MARLAVAAAGNADDNINLINARFQAEALRRLRGYDCGVLDNSFYSDASPRGLTRSANVNFMWPLTYSGVANISVGRGMATAYGFDIQSETVTHFTATAPSAGTKYLFIYLEWDFSNPVEALGKIDIHDNGSSASWTPPYQDNLITNPIGKYQMPLYRLTVNTAGTITSTVAWSALGVKTIGNALLSENTRHAEQSDEATYATGNRAAGTFDERFASLNTRLNQLGFKTASVTVYDSDYMDAQNTALYQLGKVAYGGITFKGPVPTQSSVSKNVGYISGITLPSSAVTLLSFTQSGSGNVHGASYTWSRTTTFTLNPSGIISVVASGSVNGQYTPIGTFSASKVVVFDAYQGKVFI